jgi:hypothetical protein
MDTNDLVWKSNNPQIKTLLFASHKENIFISLQNRSRQDGTCWQYVTEQTDKFLTAVCTNSMALTIVDNHWIMEEHRRENGRNWSTSKSLLHHITYHSNNTSIKRILESGSLVVRFLDPRLTEESMFSDIGRRF